MTVFVRDRRRGSGHACPPIPGSPEAPAGRAGRFAPEQAEMSGAGETHG